MRGEEGAITIRITIIRMRGEEVVDAAVSVHLEMGPGLAGDSAGHDVEYLAGNVNYFGDGYAPKVCLDAGKGQGRILDFILIA